MDFLRKILPIAFNVVPKESNTLVKSIIIHAIIGYVVSGVLGFILGVIGGLAGIEGVMIALSGLMGTVLGVYGTGGIVVSILKFVGVIKQ